MSYLVKAILADAAVEYYRNYTNDVVVIAKRITLCNTSASPVTVNLSFFNPLISETFETGAVLFGKSIPANDSITEVIERELQSDDTISAYASVADVISLSVDIEGDKGRYIPTPP